MAVTAKLRYLHIAPRKVRLVADLIRGKSVERSQGILEFTNKEVSRVLLKLLKSALANAKNNFQLNEANLYISKILVDEGPKSKRWRPQSRGRANEILKRTSHITVILNEVKKQGVAEKKKIISKKISEKIKETKAPTTKTDKKTVKINPVRDYKGKEEAQRGQTSNGVKEPEIKSKFERPKPKIVRGLKRVFRRKAF